MRPRSNPMSPESSPRARSCSTAVRTSPRSTAYSRSQSRPDTAGAINYGGVKANDAKKLEKENVQLKRIVANQALDIDTLRHIAEGKF